MGRAGFRGVDRWENFRETETDGQVVGRVTGGHEVDGDVKEMNEHRSVMKKAQLELVQPVFLLSCHFQTQPKN